MGCMTCLRVHCFPFTSGNEMYFFLHHQNEHMDRQPQQPRALADRNELISSSLIYHKNDFDLHSYILRVRTDRSVILSLNPIKAFA